MENTKRKDGKWAKFVLVAALVVVVAVLVVYVGRIYPPASQEEATGTIGAVKKYRVQQISDQDVVLAGQEAEQAQAPAAVLLNDAAKLQNIGARLVEMASKLQSAQLEKKVALANMETEIESLNSSLVEVSAELQNRALVNMREWAAEANEVLAGNRIGLKEDELALMQASMANIVSQMANLSARIGSAEHENLANRLAAFNGDLEAKRRFSRAAVDEMNVRLAGHAERLAASAPVEQNYLENMKEQFSECAAMLKLSAQLSADSLEAHRLARKVMAKEYEELANANLELAATRRFARESGADVSELANRLSTVGNRLSSRSYEMEQETMQNVKAVLSAMSAEQNSLENLSSAMELASKRLRARTDLAERDSAELQARIGAVDQELAGRMQNLARNSIGNIQLQMRLIGSSLQNEAPVLESRYKFLQNAVYELNGRLANQKQLMGAETMKSLDSKLNGVQEKLANMGLMEAKRKAAK